MIIGINGNEANVASRVGSNQYAFQLLRQLKRLQTTKFVVYLKNPPLPDLPKPSQNWQYQVFGPGKLWTQLALPVRLSLEKQKPDVFFTPGHYAPRWCPMPSVISVLDLAFLKYPKSFRTRDLSQLKAWTKYSVKQASHIIVISESTKKDTVGAYRVSPKKVSVIYPGLISLKPKDKIIFKGPYLLYIGTLQPRKNIERLIKVFSQLKGFSGKLMIVGKKGWLYQSIFDLVKKLKLEKRVVFTGFIPDDKLATILKNAQLLVNPSLYEGFGFPVLQAMALGTPVLVSRCSSLPEIVGNAGFYIEEPASTESIKKGIIKALSLKESEMAQLVKKAKQRAKQFTWQKTAEQTLKILCEVVK